MGSLKILFSIQLLLFAFSACGQAYTCDVYSFEGNDSNNKRLIQHTKYNEARKAVLDLSYFHYVDFETKKKTTRVTRTKTKYNRRGLKVSERVCNYAPKRMRRNYGSTFYHYKDSLLVMEESRGDYHYRTYYNYDERRRLLKKYNFNFTRKQKGKYENDYYDMARNNGRLFWFNYRYSLFRRWHEGNWYPTFYRYYDNGKTVAEYSIRGDWRTITKYDDGGRVERELVVDELDMGNSKYEYQHTDSGLLTTTYQCEGYWSLDSTSKCRLFNIYFHNISKKTDTYTYYTPEGKDVQYSTTFFDNKNRTIKQVIFEHKDKNCLQCSYPRYTLVYIYH